MPLVGLGRSRWEDCIKTAAERQRHERDEEGNGWCLPAAFMGTARAGSPDLLDPD